MYPKSKNINSLMGLRLLYFTNIKFYSSKGWVLCFQRRDPKGKQRILSFWFKIEKMWLQVFWSVYRGRSCLTRGDITVSSGAVG